MCEEKKKRTKKGLRRESNPGHLHPKQILYHLTTKPSEESVKKSQIRVEREGREVGKRKEKRKERCGCQCREAREKRKKEKKKRSRWGSNPRSFAPEANAFPLRHRTIQESGKEVSHQAKSGQRGRERGKKGLRRESNPGHPHPKRVFYHLTTKPSGKESRER